MCMQDGKTCKPAVLKSHACITCIVHARHLWPAHLCLQHVPQTPHILALHAAQAVLHMSRSSSALNKPMQVKGSYQGPSWDVDGLLILGHVACPDPDILPVRTIRSTAALDDPLAVLAHAKCRKPINDLIWTATQLRLSLPLLKGSEIYNDVKPLLK